MSKILAKDLFLDSFFNPLLFNLSRYYDDENFKNYDSHYEYQLVIPGVDKSDINIFIEKNNINIEHKPSDNKNNFVMEGFIRSLIIPENANITKINAKLENGILSILIPKINQEAEKRSIKIE
jgi:HSP20 family protein